jgi:hypothetical protein
VQRAPGRLYDLLFNPHAFEVEANPRKSYKELSRRDLVFLQVHREESPLFHLIKQKIKWCQEDNPSSAVNRNWPWNQSIELNFNKWAQAVHSQNKAKEGFYPAQQD